MKKVGIVTIYDLNNYGNRLQNYALQTYVEKYGMQVTTIKNDFYLNQALDKKNVLKNIYMFQKRYIKFCINRLGKDKRLLNFIRFDRNVKKTKNFFWKNKKSVYDYYIVGSDQVWNPMLFRMTGFELLKFFNCNNKISYAASIGVNNIDEASGNSLKNELKKYKAISVRENAGKEIIDRLEIEKNVEVLIDPTMLLDAEEWDKVSNKPEIIKVDERYILNYFLGKLPVEWEKEIKRVAEENNCKIINILDEDDPYFISGPSEFLYLEKNAFLICTDSFHSSVFSIIYDTPFVVFNRKDKHASMSSRIDTLVSKFGLENRKFSGSISDDLLKCDYSNAKKILEKEKEKTRRFLCSALDIKE